MDYKKPQSTLVRGGVGLYPLTTADQVILADGSRLEKDGRISADSAANSAKLGGKAPEYYLQPRNLLDNSDFRNPVNQRGKTSYTGSGYCLDRWYSNMGEYLTVTVNDGKVSLSKSLSGGDFKQYLPIDLTDKTVTFAVCTSHGVFCKSCIVSGTSHFVQIESFNAYLGVSSENGITTFRIYFNDSSDVQLDLYWAALYEGSYTAETLPPYVSKGYAAELAECRLYYRPQQMYCLYCYSGGYAAGINFEPMRPGVIPTPVNVKAQTMAGDNVAGETNIVVIQIDRVSYVANPNFTYGNYYRVFSEFSSDL